MPFYKVCLAIAVLALPLFTPAYAKDKATKTPPSSQAEPQQAHEFFAYLVKLGIIDIDTKMKCHNGEVIPDTTAYMQEPCTSVVRAGYSCNEGKEKYTAETRIDWRYVSEIALSGYNHDGEEIEISGNITTSHTKGILAEKAKANQGKPTRKAKLNFDSSATAKRALNAFTLLKNKCDTSADYPF